MVVLKIQNSFFFNLNLQIDIEGDKVFSSLIKMLVLFVLLWIFGVDYCVLFGLSPADIYWSFYMFQAVCMMVD